MSAPWTPTASAKRRVRDYHKRQYGNPLFRRDQRTSRRSTREPGAWKRYAIAGITLFAAGTGAWYLFWSPTFTIDVIEVNGATPSTERQVRDILDAELARKTAWIVPRSSVFLFDKHSAEAAIAGDFHFESLQLAKKLPRTLVVDVTEIPKRAVLYADGRFFAVSSTGAVIRDLTEREQRELGDMPPDIAATALGDADAELVELTTLMPNDAPEAAKQNGNGTPLLFDERLRETAPTPGDALFSEVTLALILQANVRLPDIAGNAVRWFTVRENDDAVDVTMEGDWHLYLTTTLPFEAQGERLGLILREKVGDDRSRLDYIDLRYNERAYIRYKDDPAP